MAHVVDPLGGSYYVEALTDAMEERIVAIMDDIEAHGGMVRGVEDGYVQRLIADEAFDQMQRDLTAGSARSSGVNCFRSDEPAPEPEGYEMDDAGRRRQLERLAEVKRTRDEAEVRRTLDALSAASRGDDVNLMHPLIDCAHAYCTVGEMVGVLKEEWGEFRQPAVF